MFESLAQFFREGGPAMMVNLATAAVAVAIIVERIIVLAFSLNLNAGPFMEQIQKLVLSNNVDRAVKLCQATEAPVARVTGFDTPFPYALENEYLPRAPRILRAIRETVAF